MTLYANYVVYPEGDMQEIPHTLSINQIVDLNGFPLTPPLPTFKMIVYRVHRISRKESKGEVNTYHYLELVKRDEMLQYM
jgi:hypothetical protein